MSEPESERDRVRAEAMRVVAEIDRIRAEGQESADGLTRRQAETGRSTAENGRTDAETGRTDAETLREDAETRREKLYPSKEFSPKLAWLVAIVILASSIGSGFVSYRLSTDASVSSESARVICQTRNVAVVSLLRLYNDLVHVNQIRVDTAIKVGDEATAAANRYARNQYRIDRAGFIAAYGAGAAKPGSPTPAGVRQECG